MPEYDAENFEPPAPIAYVTLRHPAIDASLSHVRSRRFLQDPFQVEVIPIYRFLNQVI
jgi:hypothetical protein